MKYQQAAGHDFDPYPDNLENCRLCGAHRGNHTFPLHVFVGRSDWDCEVCSAPDRSKVHSASGHLIHGWNCIVRYKTWAAADPDKNCDCGAVSWRVKYAPRSPQDTPWTVEALEANPHAFQGRPLAGYEELLEDRDCEQCGWPDRNPVHRQTPETDRAELADLMRRHTPRFVLYVSVVEEPPYDPDVCRPRPFLNERIVLENRAVAEALFEHLAGQVKLASFFKPVLDKAPKSTPD